MTGIQMGNFISFASQFNFDKYHKHCDIGGSGGHLSIQIVKHNPHIASKSFDLPKVARIARQNIMEMGLSNNVESVAGNFFKDDFPKVDVITIGNILHDWGMQDKKDLIKKAYEALPGGGALVVIENIIDDGRCENTFGLLMSLNMLIETEAGFDFSAADFAVWAKDTGFKEVYVMPLTGPASAVIATK